MYAPHYRVPDRPAADGTISNIKKQPDHAGSEEHHFYSTLNIPEGRNIYGLGNNQYTDNDKFYQNYGSICIEQPLYNLIEEISTEQGLEGPTNDGAEQVYSVLEEPYFDDSESSSHYGTISSEEPVYSTLERPSQEDPKCVNESIYNVLDEVPNPSISTENEV